MDAGRRITSVMAHVRYAAANRIRPRPEVSRTFYPQQPTCQISNMWLIFETFFGQRTEGLFVEVGAFDGVLYSNTWGLAARGWRGLLIEPVPEFAASARKAHADHRAVQVVQTAIGASPGTAVMTTAGAFSSEDPEMIDEWESLSWRRRGRQVSVLVRTLDDVLAEFTPSGEIDLLVVDVEGRERDALAGFSWSRLPRMVILELPDLHPSPMQRGHAAIEIREDLLRRGYGIAYKDPINTVFVRPDVWQAAWP